MRTQRIKPIHWISRWPTQHEESSLQPPIHSKQRRRWQSKGLQILHQEHHLEEIVHQAVHSAELAASKNRWRKLKPKSSISEKIFNRWKKTWTLSRFGWTLESNIPKFSIMILRTLRIAEMASSTSKVTKSTSSCLQISSSFLQTSWSSSWYTWAAKAAQMTSPWAGVPFQ